MKKQTKKYENRTLTAMFENDRFGEGALKSMPLNDEGMDIIKNLKEGSSLVLKPGRRKDGTPVTTKNGSQTYFLEVLPPLESNNRSSASDDI